MTDVPTIFSHSLAGHTGPVNAIKTAQSGRYVMSCSTDRTVKLWNPIMESKSGKVKGMLIKSYGDTHNYDIADIAISHDQQKFFSVGTEKIAYMTDVSTGQMIRKFQGHGKKITCCEVMSSNLASANSTNEDSNLLLTGSGDRTIKIWDLRSSDGKKGRRGAVESLADARDALTCMWVVRNKDAVTSDVKPNTNGRIDESVTDVYNSSFMTGSMDGCLRHYDIRKGVVTVDNVFDPISSIALSNDNNCLLISTLMNRIILKEKDDSGEELQRYEGHRNVDNKIQAILDPTDSFVISGSEDGKLVVWELVEGDIVHKVQIDQNKSNAFAETPAGIAAAREKEATKKMALSTAFVNDDYMICGCSDGDIRIFSKNNRKGFVGPMMQG